MKAIRDTFLINSGPFNVTATNYHQDNGNQNLNSQTIILSQTLLSVLNSASDAQEMDL